MSIGISDEHVELASTLRRWAAGLGAADVVRAAEADPAAAFDEVWKGLVEMGVPTIGLAEAAGGGGGSLLDVAVAVEACAHEVLPGALLSTAAAALLLADAPRAAGVLEAGGRAGVGPVPSLRVAGDRLVGRVAVVHDAPGADVLLLGADGGQWYAVPGPLATTTPAGSVDLSRRAGSVDVDVALTDVEPLRGLAAARLRRTLLTLAAAEAAGLARWCVTTAADYAKVREQFGRPIGSFQAVKHLCAQMLETAETVTAAAWDAASAGTAGDDAQWAVAVDVAGAVALDGAVRVAQDCVQVLGGIGFTFEHDAHLRLRRATSLRNLLGTGDAHAASLADRAVAGERRTVVVDLEGRDAGVRDEVRALVAGLVGLEGGDLGTPLGTALVDTGLLVPHWPAPYGRGADPVEQVVVDEELAAAGIERPDLKIAAWAVPTILAHGTDEQRERFVRPSLLGEVVWCQLFSEPEAGSDLASLRTRAERVEGGWELTGQKVWTSMARESHWGICLARTNPDAPQHKGITYFLVDMASPGIEIRPLREMTGDALFNEVFLDRVFVPDAMVVGEVDGGWALARGTLANERVAMGGSRLGASTERAVALLAAAGDAAGPSDRVRVGHAVALSTVGGLLATRATLKAVAGAQPGAESSIAKLVGVRSRQTSSELVVDLHGPALVLGGPEADADAHEALLTRCLSIAGGTTQVLKNIVGERLLGLPR